MAQIRSLALLLALACAVSAIPRPSSCSRYPLCTRDVDCFSGSCCYGQCREADPAFLGDVQQRCGATCLTGSGGLPGRCERGVVSIASENAGSPMPSGCGCKQHSDCISALCVKQVQSDTYGNCSSAFKPGNAPCFHSAECASGTCLNATLTCTQVADGAACTQAQNSFPCSQTSLCVMVAADSATTTCSAQKGAGGYCQSPIDCSAGLACNTTSNQCVAFGSGVAGQPCVANILCASGICLSTGVCSTFGSVRGKDETCPDGTINCLPGFQCVGTAPPSIAAADALSDFTLPTCQPMTGRQCDPSFLSSTPCGNYASCACMTGQTESTCQVNEQTVPMCSAELYEASRYWGTPTLQNWANAAGAFWAQQLELVPPPARNALAAYVCCACENAYTPSYDIFSNAWLVQIALGAHIDCGTTPPTVTARKASVSSAVCSAVTRVALDDVIAGCRAAPSPPGKTAWQKARIPVIASLASLGGVVVIGVIAVVIMKVVGGGGGGAKAAGAKAAAPTPTAPTAVASTGEF